MNLVTKMSLLSFLFSSIALGGCDIQNTNIISPNQTNTTNQQTNQLQRKDPLAGVYHPSRLHVVNPCKTVSGTVERVRKEPDHDYHVNLKLDSQYTNLLKSGNFKHENGDLVVEIIPMDQPYIPKPKVGEHITVTGAYVIDGVHGGWSEIHPAWIVNGKGSVHYSEEAAAKSVQTGIDGNNSYFGNSKGSLTDSE